MATPELKPCPFCGGPAGFEECTPEQFPHTTWSVGCRNENEDCIATQMIASFSRKEEAAKAWNQRHPGEYESGYTAGYDDGVRAGHFEANSQRLKGDQQ